MITRIVYTRALVWAGLDYIFNPQSNRKILALNEIMASFETQESIEQDFTLDCLPLDCIICICEYLTAEDLAKFSRVCRVSVASEARGGRGLRLTYFSSLSLSLSFSDSCSMKPV